MLPLTGTIVSMKRLRNSTSGGPQWAVTVGENGQTITFKTRPDATIGYAMSTHWEGSRFAFSIDDDNFICDAVSATTPTERKTP